LPVCPGEVQIIMGKYYKSCFLVAQPGKLFSQKYSQTGCSLANNIAILSHKIAILIVTQIAQSNLQAYTNKLQVEIQRFVGLLAKRKPIKYSEQQANYSFYSYKF
jgi:hypothetical protein